MDDSLNLPLKQCVTCKQFFPATPEHFYHDKHKQYGLSNVCKACRKASDNKPTTITPPTPGTMKQCSICNQPFPATADYFTRSRRTSDGLNAACKKCRYERKNAGRATPQAKEKAHKYYTVNKAKYRERERRYYRRDRAALGKYPRFIPDLKEGEKWCPFCKQVLPATPRFFPRNKNYLDGLHGRCKQCAKAYNDAHKEQMKPYYRRYYQEHREESKKYRQTHITKLTEYDRQYYQTHKSRIVERHRRYRQTEKGRLVGRIACLKYTARKKAVKGTHTAAQIAEQLKRQHYRCYYEACGHAKFERRREKGEWKYKYHVEHTFPIARITGTDIPGNDISYLVLACPSCNTSKQDKFPWEWPQGNRLL